MFVSLFFFFFFLHYLKTFIIWYWHGKPGLYSAITPCITLTSGFLFSPCRPSDSPIYQVCFFSCLHTHTHTHTVFREFHLDNLLSIFAFLCFFPNCCFYPFFFLLIHFDFPIFLHLLTFTFNCSIRWLFLLALKSSAEKCKWRHLWFAFKSNTWCTRF